MGGETGEEGGESRVGGLSLRKGGREGGKGERVCVFVLQGWRGRRGGRDGRGGERGRVGGLSLKKGGGKGGREREREGFHIDSTHAGFILSDSGRSLFPSQDRSI